MNYDRAICAAMGKVRSADDSTVTGHEKGYFDIGKLCAENGIDAGIDEEGIFSHHQRARLSNHYFHVVHSLGRILYNDT